MLEGVKLARKIGRNPALAQFLELEIMPGDAVGDDQLADAIASNLASYGHPAATAPMGGPEDPWAVVDSHGAVKGIDGLRVVDASIMPVVVSVALNPTTIMIAERIAKSGLRDRGWTAMPIAEGDPSMPATAKRSVTRSRPSITPQNSAFVLIDYQPSQFATVRSMDEDLLLRTSSRP